MTVSPIRVEAFQVTIQPEDRISLDPIHVFLHDIAPGQGRLVVECFGRAWSGYWGAMGDRTLRQFVHDVDADYLANAMSTQTKRTRAELSYLCRVMVVVKLSLEQTKHI